MKENKERKKEGRKEERMKIRAEHYKQHMILKLIA